MVQVPKAPQSFAGVFLFTAIVLILTQISNSYNTLQLSQHKNYRIQQSGLGPMQQIPTLNYKNLVVSTTIQIGSNNQTFTVMLDTGSPALWVQSPLCGNCPPRKQFNFDQSNTLKYSGFGNQISYGGGAVKGQRVSDEVSLGAIRTRLDFLIAYEQSLPPSSGFDGLIGLGKFSEVQNIFQKAYLGGAIVSPMFAFQIYRAQTSAPSQLYYNFTADMLPDVTFFDTIDETLTWNISLSSLTIGSKQYPQTNAVPDTGSTNLALPSALYKKLDDDFFSDFCSEYVEGYMRTCFPPHKVPYPDLVFKFDNGFEIVIQADDFITTDNGNIYSLGVMVNPIDVSLVLGLPFFYQHFVVFDNENSKIGIMRNPTNFFTLFKTTAGVFAFKWLLILVFLTGCAIYTKVKPPTVKEDFSLWLKHNFAPS